MSISSSFYYSDNNWNNQYKEWKKQKEESKKGRRL